MKKILVGISGASGAPIAIRLLKRLREMADVETHLIMTKRGRTYHCPGNGLYSRAGKGTCRCGV